MWLKWIAVRLPRAWVQYLVALGCAGTLAADLAGWLSLSILIVLPLALLFLTLLAEIVCVPLRWSRFGVWSLIPTILLLAALPSGYLSGYSLLQLRFWANLSRYESISQQVVAGDYPQKMRAEDERLAHWVSKVEFEGHPVGAKFGVVSHGYAGHNYFLYVLDETKRDRVLHAGSFGPETVWTTMGAHAALLGD